MISHKENEHNCLEEYLSHFNKGSESLFINKYKKRKEKLSAQGISLTI